jgi:hypothetical protein
MDLGNDTTQRCPAPLIQSQGHYLLAIRSQVGTKYWTHAHGIAGTLKLDRSIDAIGIGAGECAEPALRGCLGQGLWARGPETEGEMGVGVEVGEHVY